MFDLHQITFGALRENESMIINIATHIVITAGYESQYRYTPAKQDNTVQLHSSTSLIPAVLPAGCLRLVCTEPSNVLPCQGKMISGGGSENQVTVMPAHQVIRQHGL